MEEGKVFAGRRIQVERETEVLAVVDGDYGFGQTVGEQTVDLGVAKARRHGVAVTALKNSGHLGRIGDWAERAAESNCASIHMVNVRGSLIVAPYGAIERRGSTSPFCAGVPRPDAPPIIHDFATSVVAEGKAMVALHGGKPLPGDALVDADGNYTSDPLPLYGETPPGQTPNPNAGPGALNPFGLHKGSGLNFFMEMFGGALTGSGTAAAPGETGMRRFCNGMFSIYMQVDAFHDDDWFAREVSAYVEYWKAARPLRAGGEVLVPGEKERMTMAERLESGPAAFRGCVGGPPRRDGESGDERRRGGSGARLKRTRPGGGGDQGHIGLSTRRLLYDLARVPAHLLYLQSACILPATNCTLLD